MRRRNVPSSKSMLLVEFMFYNKTKKIVDNKILLKLKKDLLENKDKKRIFWSNKIFADNKFCFKLFKQQNNEKEEVYIDFKELKYNFNPSLLENCSHIISNTMIVTFDIDYEKLNLFESIINNVYNLNNKTIEVFSCWNDMLNFLIKNKYLNKYDKQPSYRKQTFLNDYKTLFDEELDKEICVMNDNYSSVEIFYIAKVIEKRINNKNYRTYIYAHTNGSSIYYGLKVVGDEEKDYTLIDEKRIYMICNQKNYFFDTGLINFSENNKLLLNNHLNSHLYTHLKNILSEKENIITGNIYRFYKERYESNDYSYNENITKTERLILERYKQLLEQDKQIKIGDILLGKTKIEINGMVITFEKDFLDVIDNINRIKQILNIKNAKFNFNIIYENLLKISVLRYIDMCYTRDNCYKNFTETKFVLNDIPILIKKENNRIKINDIFCRIDDVFHIVSKAICFITKEEYENYIKDVSFIGIEWKKMICDGVHIELNNPFFKVFNKIDSDKLYDTIILRFSLLWDTVNRNIIYLLLNNKKYRIRFKQKFKKYFNHPKTYCNITELKTMLEESLEEIDDDIILEIVENGIKEGEIIKQRGEELVRLTINDIKAKEEEVEINLSKVKGYIFVGRITGSKYFVNKEDLSVWKWTNSSWNRRCIVDDNNKQRIFEDRLANRLINIYNEPPYLSRFLKT